MIKPEKITADDILLKTNGGWDIFKHEIGKFPISKAFKHPLRKDKSSSGVIVCRGGIWFLKDFGEKMSTMTAIQFIQNKYGLTFNECIRKLSVEYGIVKGENKEYTPVEIDWTAPSPEESEIVYNFDTTKWRKEHHEFWEGTDVTPKHCEKYNTWAVKECLVNKARIYMRPNEVVWAYYAEDIDKVKLYFPERERGSGRRFRGNVPGDYLWGIDKIIKCQKMVLIKSMKDLLCTTLIHPCTVAVQNESSAIFSEEMIAKINKISKKTFVAFGSDKQGHEQSEILKSKTGWGSIETDPNLLPDINDFYGLSKKFGVKRLENLLKSKNIL